MGTEYLIYFRHIIEYSVPKKKEGQKGVMMLITSLTVFGIVVIIGAVLWGAYQIWGTRQEGAGSTSPREEPHLLLPIALLVLGVLFLVWTRTGTAYIAPTHVGVVENSFSGSIKSLRPGTHFFPIEPKLVPFVTRVYSYSLRQQQVEIGVPQKGVEFQQTAVEADSSSPGRPAVYFYARGWAAPNPELVAELHRKYGPDYLRGWVEKNWISILKSVQGRNEYNYVGSDRVGFQSEVEKHLQEALLIKLAGDQPPIPLVVVSQLAVVNYAFSNATEQFLQTVQKVEFDRQQAATQIEVNKKQQDAERISVETSYIVEVRNAERDRDARIARATGEAQGVILAADAEKYRIQEIYVAESEGILKVQQSLAQSPEAYLEYQKNKQWNGELPQYMLGSGVVPFLDLTPQ